MLQLLSSHFVFNDLTKMCFFAIHAYFWFNARQITILHGGYSQKITILHTVIQVTFIMVGPTSALRQTHGIQTPFLKLFIIL